MEAVIRWAAEEVIVKNVLFAALAVFLVCGSAAAGQEKWVPFASKQARFSIEMPTTPKETSSTTSSFIGDVTNEIFTSWEGDEKFTVDHSQIPHFALHFAGADTIYDHASAALLKQTWSKQRSFDDITVNGHKGKQLTYDTPTRDGKTEVTGLANLFLVGDRLYVIDAIVPVGDSEAHAKRFLGSVRFD
jgi:hypothetical protein